jgi:hypothetical protein
VDDRAHQEKRQCVEWQTHSVETESIQPDFDVFACNQNVCPPELLVIGVVTVGTETCLNKGTLFLREPGHRGGIVGYEPIRRSSDEDSKQSFLSWLSAVLVKRIDSTCQYEDPSPACIAANVTHMCNSPS